MEKKTKLTISGGIAKKSIKNIDKAKTLGKNSVVIQKQTGKFSGKVGTFKSNFSKPNTTSSSYFQDMALKNHLFLIFAFDEITCQLSLFLY